ncbi:MAG: hypothetical protein AAFU79_00625 [Myxococcota bacterium]
MLYAGLKARLEGHGDVRRFELGTYLADAQTFRVWIDPEHGDLAAAGLRRVRSFAFANRAMEREVAKMLPPVPEVVSSETHKLIVFAKRRDLVLLRDLCEHLQTKGERLDPRHVAWILSGLYALACWLAWAQLSHQAINLDTVFVSPEHHGVFLLGGWWYATPIAKSVAALPESTVADGPPGLERRRRALRQTDLELIRALGRRLLGDPSGARLTSSSRVPKPMGLYLMLPAGHDAVSEYAAWMNILESSFGARRFTELAIQPSDIYPEEI